MPQSEAFRKTLALETLKSSTGALSAFYPESIKKRNQHEQEQWGSASQTPHILVALFPKFRLALFRNKKPSP
jgi:hypothetical protein